MQHLPSYSIILFLFLFLLSTFFYTGGSRVDIQATSFSWIHNYWCDLIWPTNYREETNPVAWVAVPAMLMLCIGLGILFYQFPTHYTTNPYLTAIIRIFGIAAMVWAALLFTPLHNIAIPLASCCGGIALLAVFMVLYQNQAMGLFNFGLFCLFLLLLNNLIYYLGAGIWLYYLPLLQKVSIFIILGWILAIDLS